MPTEQVFHDPNEEESNEWFAFQTAINWCQGTIVQGNRVLSLHFPKISLELSMREYRRQIDEWQINRLIDEHFFLVAARQIIRWCKRAQKQYPELVSSLEEFCSDSNIINTRDMREHNDEYLEGRGWRQDDYVAEVDTNCSFPGNQNGTCDASSTVISGDQYLIGGRVDVRQTLEKVNSLLSVLVPFMNEKWPWTASPQGETFR